MGGRGGVCLSWTSHTRGQKGEGGRGAVEARDAPGGRGGRGGVGAERTGLQACPDDLSGQAPPLQPLWECVRTYHLRLCYMLILPVR